MKIIQFIKRIYKRRHTLKDYLVLREAIQMADREHEQTKERYYVAGTMDGKLIIVNRKNFRLMKRKHYINQEMNIRDLTHTCFYCTPYPNGSNLPTEIMNLKRRQYYQWCIERRKKK